MSTDCRTCKKYDKNKNECHGLLSVPTRVMNPTGVSNGERTGCPCHDSVPR